MKIKYFGILPAFIFFVSSCNMKSTPPVEAPIVLTSTQIITPAPAETMLPTITFTPTAEPFLTSAPPKGIPDNLITFAIDESASMSSSPNCPLSRARYDIPNLFLPLFQQYYSNSIIGSKSQGKYAPWIEVVRWPYKKYAISPTKASDLDYHNLLISPASSDSDAFFDEIFKSFHEESKSQNSQEIPRRSLIFFTDGSFQGGAASTANTWRERTSSEIEKIAADKSAKFDIHVVLLCPKKDMDPSDYNWWIEKENSYSDWFHLYEEKDLYTLTLSLWSNFFSSKFPVEDWDDESHGIYLISKDGYWNLAYGPDSSQLLDPCKTVEGNNSCINFSFRPDATGFYGGAVTVGDELDSRSFIWKDGWIEMFPEARADPFYKTWDNKVIPNNGCASPHNWVFNPGALSNAPLLFWWRASSDIQVDLIPEAEEIVLFYGGESSNKNAAQISFKVLPSSDFMPLTYMLSCYDAVLSLNNLEVSTKKINANNDNEGIVEWNIREEVNTNFPNFSNQPVEKGLPLEANVKIVNENSLGAMIMQQENFKVRMSYVPTFLRGEYEKINNSLKIGEGNEPLTWEFPFQYVTQKFFPDRNDFSYLPSFYIVNEEGQKCTSEIRFQASNKTGGEINIIPISSDIPDGGQTFRIEVSSTIFANNLISDCSNIDDLSFRVVWSSWTSTGGCPAPVEWECKVQDNTCMIYDGG